MKTTWHAITALAAAPVVAGCPGGGDDAIAPRLVASAPALGASGVYPARLFGGTAPRVRISLRFDEVMDPERATVAWAARGDVATALTGTWSDDARELVLDIVGAPLTGQRPLADLTPYEVDVAGLRDLAGNRVDPGAGLDAGKLRFTTGVYDALLNHSCGHVQLGPYAEAAASPLRAAQSARTDVAHTRYTVRLVEAGGSYAGFTRIRAASDATWHLFLDGDAPLALETDAGEPLPLAIAAMPDACDGITTRATFEAAALDQRFLVFGPQLEPAARFIVELVPR